MTGRSLRHHPLSISEMDKPLALFPWLLLFAALTLAPTAIAAKAASESSSSNMAAIESQFRQLPMEDRRHIGPLFFLHGDESKERLEMYVGKVAEGGNGSFTPESRPHSDWLGEGWWHDLSICLQSAKERNLKMWIFDEKMWPSQAVGGNVPPRYAAKRLEGTATDIDGPRTIEADGYGGEDYIGSVAGRVGSDEKIVGSTLIDLSSHVRADKLRWQAPAGKWKVIKFTYKQAPGLIQQRGKQLAVDGASRDCVDWFLQTVYQPHYDHFKADFGRTISGFFYDEPEVPGDWGTELNHVLAERKVDWKKAYVAYKFQLAGDDQTAARYQYLDALAETWGRTMYGGMTAWCERRGVKSIGHFMEHSKLYVSPEFCAGNMMSLQKYSSMGGIDAVFNQFAMGTRTVRDAPCWQTPKLASSISHAYGKANDDAMVEIFGARGQDLTYPEMKWWADHMQVSGVDFLVPHSFNPRSPNDTDCPPYFYNGGFEPRWPLYRLFADYTSRLSLMLTGGHHVCPVALLFVGQSAQCGKSVLPDQMSEVLQDALYDCDWIPFEVLENDMTVSEKALKLRNESYKVLVVPPIETIPYPALAKVKRFFDQGGVVLGYGFLPSKSATLGRTSADIARLCTEVWGNPRTSTPLCKTNSAGGRSYLLAAEPTSKQLQQVLADDASIHPDLEVVKGSTDHWVHVLHRVKAGCDVFFIANQNHTGTARQFEFRATAAGIPERWDAMRNEITAIPYTRHGKQVDLSMTLEPNESALLVFQTSKRAVPSPRKAGYLPDHSAITVQRDATPPSSTPALQTDQAEQPLQACSWVWYPESTAAPNAPPGTRYFRRQITLDQSKPIKKATFTGTADNSLTLFINSQSAGKSDGSANGWRNPVTLDVTALLQSGKNELAIEANNSGEKPNPAGLIGCLAIDYGDSAPLVMRVDDSWKTSDARIQDWILATCDDSSWVNAKQLVQYGSAPWNHIGKLTLSPVKANPFIGHCDIGSDVLRRTPIYLDMDAPSPEPAARIAVNGHDAGGFIGLPARLDVTRYLKSGINTFRIEPFASQAVRLVYRKEHGNDSDGSTETVAIP